MKIDEKTISCLQCGSTDVDMESEKQGTCNACGAKFIEQQNIDKQNTDSEINAYNSEPIQEKEYSCKKYEIKPEYSKTEFMRRVWITLAKEDAPIEVFSENFDDVSIIEHQVVIDKLTVDTTYQFSVGYYRDEPYIDYETYYEDEPYITSESYYDTYTKTTKTRPVTKYKSVRKERQVTKYKKVTDWSNSNGTHRAQSTAFVENVEKLYLDDELFEESFREMKAGSFSPLPSDEAKSIKVAEFTKLLVRLRHNQNVEDSIINSLPGDDYRDLDWKVSGRLEQTTDLYKAPEYETTITYNGKTYKKYAFPFGTMEIGGDIIRNQLDLDTITEDMRNTLDEKEKERRDAIKKM